MIVVWSFVRWCDLKLVRITAEAPTLAKRIMFEIVISYKRAISATATPAIREGIKCLCQTRRSLFTNLWISIKWFKKLSYLMVVISCGLDFG